MTAPTRRRVDESQGKGAAAPLCTACNQKIKRTEYRRNGGHQPRWVHVRRGNGDRHKVQVSDRGVGHIKCHGCEHPVADHDWWAPCPQ